MAQMAQLTVVYSDANGSHYHTQVLGGLFVYDLWDKKARRLSGLWRWEPMQASLEMKSDTPLGQKGGPGGTVDDKRRFS